MPSAKLQLRLAQSAQSDLLEAWFYIAENNLTAQIDFSTELTLKWQRC